MHFRRGGGIRLESRPPLTMVSAPLLPPFAVVLEWWKEGGSRPPPTARLASRNCWVSDIALDTGLCFILT